jgi:two-component system OmpR family sensor kinase
MSDRAWYRSLYWRIAMGFILFLAMVVVVQGSVFLYLIARADGGLSTHSLLDLATFVATDVGNTLARDPATDVERYLQRRYGQVRPRIFVIEADGRVLSNHSAELREYVRRMAREWEAKGAPAEVEQAGLRSARAVAFARVTVHGRPPSAVATMFGRPSLRVLTEVGPIALVVALGLIVMATTLAAVFIFRPAHRRLEGLEQAARSFGGGDSRARAPEGGGDEIAEVAHAFNSMAGDLAERAEQLQASDKARRQLLADVSHELMTPLTAIRGYLETLTMPDLPLEENTRARYMEIIQQEAARLEGIIGDLLDLSRLDAGGGTLKTEDLRVEDLFARVVARHERESREKNVRLVTGIGPEASTLCGDPDRLEQALQNLAANALRHTPGGGTVELRAARDQGAIVLSVRDTGEGIPPEHLPMIFDRFYKIESSRAGVAGSGLGLSIVKAIIERHGGRISATSQPGVETVFEIRLPAAAGEG